MMAQRLTGVLVLLLILLIFTPWLYQLNAPVPRFPDLSIPPKPASAPAPAPGPAVANGIPEDAVYGVLGDGSEEENWNDPTTPYGRDTLGEVDASVASHDEVDDGKRYRVRAGVFRNPGQAMLRLNAAGYMVQKEFYGNTGAGPMYALYVGGILDKARVDKLVSALKHRFDLEALVEEYQP